MSADKRSVATDALETLGTIITPNEKRDAIHLAVENAIAAHPLRPGDDVGFVEGGVGICDNPVGIVDPFLKAPVKTGQRFWLVVYPRKITSLRHVWSHPEIPEIQEIAGNWTPSKSKEVSEKWLRDFCNSSNCPRYETVIGLAVEHAERGGQYDDDYIFVYGSDASGDIPDEFWNHLEIVTGVKAKHRATHFSCSC